MLSSRKGQVRKLCYNHEKNRKTTAKHLSFSSSSLHSLQCHAFVLPSCIGRGRGLSIALLLAVLWLVGIPVGAKSITTVSPQPNVVAAADTSMVAYTEKKTCAKIPSAYKNKIDSVLKENLPVIELNGTNSWSFTTDFVIKEMESDWGISKDNQLMFIWDNICKQLTGRYACDNKDSNTLNDFRIAVKNVRSCGQRYKEGIMPFIEEASAEYDRQSAEARKQSAEAIKGAMKADTLGITEMVGYYNAYIQNPNDVDEVRLNRLKAVKELATIIIEDCEKRGIDYRAIILKEVGDRRKLDEILKFYDIE